MNKVCNRKECNGLGINLINKRYGTSYCLKHYRFRKMRQRAQQCKKDVPTWNECEILLFVWCPTFKCPTCNAQLKWRGNIHDVKNVISLQHNIDETMC